METRAGVAAGVGLDPPEGAARRGEEEGGGGCTGESRKGAAAAQEREAATPGRCADVQLHIASTAARVRTQEAAV
jgi:hypothetical protein